MIIIPLPGRESVVGVECSSRSTVGEGYAASISGLDQVDPPANAHSHAGRGKRCECLLCQQKAIAEIAASGPPPAPRLPG